MADASKTPVRTHLVDALYADLVGPFQGASEHATSRELLRNPSDWYLTGFLVPEGDREPPPDEYDTPGEGDDVPQDDADSEEPPTKRPKLFPASMGMSVLVPPTTATVTAHVSFATYTPEWEKREGQPGRGRKFWRRVPQPSQQVSVPLDAKSFRVDLPDTPWVQIEGRMASFDRKIPGVPLGAKAISLFVVNRQASREDDDLGRAGRTLFQVQLAISCEEGFIPRPNRVGLATKGDFDAQTLELQYRDHYEYAVGHNVSAEPVRDPGESQEPVVRMVRTRWIPRSEVRLVDARTLGQRPDGSPLVTVSMRALSALTSESVDTALGELPRLYEAWLEQQAQRPVDAPRDEVRRELLTEARLASGRIAAGIERLKTNPQCLDAFKLANRAMAEAALRRSPERYKKGEVPSWRLFQLAFVLLNLDGVSEPTHEDRKTVELIFFPTGGGKTEAYLGVVAYTLLLRRMRGQAHDHAGLGVAVLLRYTLRLLTLDQLARATTLICALEVIRRERESELGSIRFSIGLWVGKSATPNRFSEFAEQLDEHKKGRRKQLPCPLERCPWCNQPLAAAGLEVRPNLKKPERVVVRCMNAGTCEFANPQPDGLPLAFIDEQVYRELPSFVIATVDKFAMMPWRGETGLLFGRATHAAEGRFFGPMDKPPRGAKELEGPLWAPDLIVQDELHLISGPLGTMVGLYEIPIQLLSSRGEGDKRYSPKIIASTATANRAREQIKALYGTDRYTSIFPPPAVDALETYFSEVNHTDPGRLYIGVAAPGHPIKRILLRVYTSLLTASKKLASDESLPAEQRDSMLTLVGYFNSLRELGGMRRLVEDDVRTQARTRSKRVPQDAVGGNPWFADREIHEPLELTSRRSTGEISEAKGRLELDHEKAKTTDVVLASNMISVGVDIDRLGLMVVAGQPKTTSEYIQASSRVGRSRKRPGLVVTCFNVARARDRSHYEHFVAYHESFYRFVEAQSVTPFAPRALDRGLMGSLVAAVRLSDHSLTGALDVTKLAERRATAEAILGAFVARSGPAGATVDEWIKHRLDKWEELVRVTSDKNIRLAYSQFDETKGDRRLLHLALAEYEELIDGEDKLSAPTSMRDVEPTVHLWLAQPGVRRSS